MTVIELFAGAGGAALGLHRAGFEHLAMVEWDADACATLRAAVAAGMLNGEVIEADIRKVDWSPYVGRVDALWASPPCQDWSSAGKRKGAKGERNGWPWTIDVIDAVGPTWAVTENVAGLLHHRNGCACPYGPVGACSGGYWTRFVVPAFERRFPFASWRVLDAADYGVPQRRERVIMVAGPRPFRWPPPTHGPESGFRLFGTEPQPWRSVREALGLTGAVQSGVATSDTGARGVRRSTDEPAPTVGGSTPMYYHPLLDEPAPTVAAGSGGKGCGQWGGGGPSRRKWERTGIRRLTPAQTAAVQSFPGDWPWQGGKTSQFAQSGNAVPPPLAEAIGRAVVAAHEAV